MERFRVAWKGLSAAVLVMAGLAGCGGASSIPARGPQQLHVNPNGLQLSVSTIFAVRTTPTGFVIEPVSRFTRSPLSISVQLMAKRPQDAGYRFRYLGSGRIAWYTLTEEPTPGSSGSYCTLIAAEHVGDRWVRYFQEKLTEDQIFELWEIADGLRYVPAS